MEGGDLLVFSGASLPRIGSSGILRSESSSGTETCPSGQFTREFWATRNNPVLEVEAVLGRLRYRSVESKFYSSIQIYILPLFPTTLVRIMLLPPLFSP